MSMVERHYLKLGYVVKDVHKTESHDFECRSRRDLIYLEVKGTRGVGSSIALTPNEVDFARLHPKNTALCIVRSIMVAGDKCPKARGGQLRTYRPWNPDQHTLKPITYICTLVNGRHVGG